MGLDPRELGRHRAIGAASDPWDDQLGDISEGVGGASLTYEAFRDTPFTMFFFRHDQDDALNLRFQLSHGWDPDTDVRCHIHIVPMADPAAPRTLRFTGYYVWSIHGSVIPELSGWTAFTSDMTISPGEAHKERVANLFVTTPPAGIVESSVLLVHAKRPGSSDAADTYTDSKSPGLAQANVGLLSLDLHYQREKLGTVSFAPTGATEQP